MARSWGINSTMGELFALLYITGEDWNAEDLRLRLDVSRGNVSMNLRELIGWGVVKKVHRPGERRELYRAESDVWTLFRRIMSERKRREVDPTRQVLDDLAQASERSVGQEAMNERVQTLRRLLGALDRLSERLMAMDAQDLADLGRLLGGGEEEEDDSTP
ncbi:GbsR/MarR family transcriptional regulator [Paludisphaera rhizosphaerae]|nr:transcriptional regulator [Paludisphaera rhizosphaerae]